jgi:hypothetical protein
MNAWRVSFTHGRPEELPTDCESPEGVLSWGSFHWVIANLVTPTCNVVGYAGWKIQTAMHSCG